MFFNSFIACIWLIASVGCSDPGQAYRYRFESSMYVDEILRTYIVKLPASYYDNKGESKSYPLVLALHGTGGSARQMEASYGLNDKADLAGFIVAYPEGVQSNGVLGIRTWNAGRCCDYAMENNIDDVAFIDSLIDHLESDFHIDPDRIYVTGMSNGGMMAYRLACELSSRIAAIAPVSSTMMVSDCTPERPVPILHIHSILDKKVPYSGGIGIGGYNFSDVDSVLNIWAINNGCTDPPGETDNGRYQTTIWGNCNADVSIQRYVTYDGGHSWPGGKQPARWADLPSAYINANDLIWEFFQRFKLP